MKEVQDILSEGVRTVGILEQIADSCTRLFDFSSMSAENAKRFAVQNGESGFSKTVNRLARILELARRDNRISREDIDVIQSSVSRIITDIWDTLLSPLWQVLGWYVVPLRATLVEAMKDAEFALSGIGSVWREEIAKLEVMYSEEEYVLVDMADFREVLRNIFSNARHSLAVDSQRTDYSDDVQVQVICDEFPVKEAKLDSAGIDKPEFVVIRVVTFGNAIKGFSNVQGLGRASGPKTIERQIKEMLQYGTEIVVKPIDPTSYGGRTGTEFVLRVISRTEVRRRMDQGPA